MRNNQEIVIQMNHQKISTEWILFVLSDEVGIQFTATNHGTEKLFRSSSMEFSSNPDDAADLHLGATSQNGKIISLPVQIVRVFLQILFHLNIGPHFYFILFILFLLTLIDLHFSLHECWHFISQH